MALESQRFALRCMLRSLSFSPADDSRLWEGETSCLGDVPSNRVPEDQFDNQPIRLGDGHSVLIADVRLDNRADLLQELGLSSESLSDSSVLAAAWLRWGLESVHHLLGAFAFVVWDQLNRKLIAVRDHAGEYPLFFHKGANFFAVASMPQAILAIPEVPTRFNQQMIANWLCSSLPSRRETFFESIERLPAGHSLTVTDSAHVIQEYWHPSESQPVRFERDTDYAEALLDILDRSTKARLRTKGRIATHLSAGLDSGAITASAATILAAEGKSLIAYTSVPQNGFQNSGIAGMLMDESSGAADLARLYPNVDHQLVSTESVSLNQVLIDVAIRAGEPALNVTNWMWIVKILDSARHQGVEVLLEGAFGNANLSYETMQPIARMFSRGHWYRVAKLLFQFRANGHISGRQAIKILGASFAPDRLGIYTARQGFDAAHLPVSTDFAHRWQLTELVRKSLFSPLADPASQRNNYDGFDSAAVVRAAATLTGVDGRDPTGDKRLWEFCYSVPLEQYIVGGRTRSLARRALNNRLPSTTLTRTQRGLQSSDWYISVGNALPQLKRQLVWISQSPAAQTMLDLDRIRLLLDTFPSKDFFSTPVYDAWNVGLLRGISLGTFLRIYDPGAPTGGWQQHLDAVNTR